MPTQPEEPGPLYKVCVECREEKRLQDEFFSRHGRCPRHKRAQEGCRSCETARSSDFRQPRCKDCDRARGARVRRFNRLRAELTAAGFGEETLGRDSAACRVAYIRGVRRMPHRLQLISDNVDFGPIQVTRDDVQIIALYLRNLASA